MTTATPSPPRCNLYPLHRGRGPHPGDRQGTAGPARLIVEVLALFEVRDERGAGEMPSQLLLRVGPSRAVKSQVRRHNCRYRNHRRKFELYFDV